MKKSYCILLVIMMLIPLTGAHALVATEEKQQMYEAAQIQLDTYLEHPNDTGRSLEYVIANLEVLGQYQYSEELLYYARVMVKLDADELDDTLDSLMAVMQLTCTERINSYIGSNSGTKLVPVNALQEYVDGRKDQLLKNNQEAVWHYQNCNGFYDSRARLTALLPLVSQQNGDDTKQMNSYDENGFVVTQVEMVLLDRSILLGKDKYSTIQMMMESPSKFDAFIYDMTSDTLSGKVLATYTPVYTIHFVQSSAIEEDLVRSITMSCAEEKYQSEEILHGLPADGILYIDLSDVISFSQWHAGTWAVEVMINNGCVLSAQMVLSN